MTETIEMCQSQLSEVLKGSLDEKLGREWLLANRRGAFAGGTVIGCPTRRYHGLLIAPKVPPLERHLLLAHMLEKVTLGDTTFDFSSFEFPGVIHPNGHEFLRDFAIDTAAENPWVRFTYSQASIELTKQVILSREENVVRISYQVSVPDDRELLLELSPLVAMRDFHSLRHQAAEDPWTIARSDEGVWVQERLAPEVSLFIGPATAKGLNKVKLELHPVWWHDFRYRVDLSRGLPGGEDLFCVGSWRARGQGRLRVELVAVAFPESPVAAGNIAAKVRSTPPANPPTPAAQHEDPVRFSLVAAADQFIVRRKIGSTGESATILAGYPWFGDWGRDSFISCEGLLLATGRFDEAKEVLSTFAGKQRNGLIPNLFSDYGDQCEYNSVDASLWFIHAACTYLRYSDDLKAWPELLAKPCRRVFQAFMSGTDFGIKMDDRGLLRCGDPSTQVTWMDAMVDGVPVTPRHGFPVEVNALWYSAIRCMMELENGTGSAGGTYAAELTKAAALIEKSFEPAFWNAEDHCLYDFLGDDGPDAAVRPNQIFAVSLRFSPLEREKQLAVVEKVREHLLTPYGLRSLSPADSRYCGRHEGPPNLRDGAYHNGTVWAWLIGPFVEAYLRVNDFSSRARAEGRKMLEPLIDHMSEACLGQISEVFDGDGPHHPRGCFAQAWSVAEVLRMYDETSAC